MILCIGTTPAAQRVMVFQKLSLDSVNRAVRTMEGWGGKAVNVAKVLTQLGQPARLLGFQGGRRGAELTAALEARGIRCTNIGVTSETRLCTTLLDESTSEVTELVEESKAVDAAAYDQLLDQIRAHAPSARAMVMSGTLTPDGPVDFYARCITAARAANPAILTVVDAQGATLRPALALHPDVVKPNRTELERTLGRSLTDEKSLWEAMGELLECGTRCVVVTDGARQVLALNRMGAWRILPPIVVAVNPIGSGDAFTAGLAASLSEGDNPGEACRKGAAAGAANALTLMSGEIEIAQYPALYKNTRVEPVKL